MFTKCKDDATDNHENGITYRRPCKYTWLLVLILSNHDTPNSLDVVNATCGTILFISARCYNHDDCDEDKPFTFCEGATKFHQGVCKGTKVLFACFPNASIIFRRNQNTHFDRYQLNFKSHVRILILLCITMEEIVVRLRMKRMLQIFQRRKWWDYELGVILKAPMKRWLGLTVWAVEMMKILLVLLEYALIEVNSKLMNSRTVDFKKLFLNNINF